MKKSRERAHDERIISCQQKFMGRALVVLYKRKQEPLDKGYTPETSFIFIFLGTGICFVLFYIHPIVSHAQAFLMSSGKLGFVKNSNFAH